MRALLVAYHATFANTIEQFLATWTAQKKYLKKIQPQGMKSRRMLEEFLRKFVFG